MSDPQAAEKPKLSVLGLGHVGLPTALGFVELGYAVTGCDGDASKVAMIRAGRTPFYEPGLDALLKRSLASGLLTLTDSVERAVRAGTVLFVCVGTPQKDNGEADLGQVEAIARIIAANLNSYKLVVEKSTVPAVTAQWISQTLARYAKPSSMADHPAPQFELASNPEFLHEGRALENFFNPDRIILGVESERGRALLEQVYRPFHCPILFTTVSTAELTKHAANAFLSTKISFINLVAEICEAVGADVTEVAQGMGLDPRIGREFLNAGIGFGGYCFPKDLRAFIHLAHHHGVDCGLLCEVDKINRRRVEILVDKLRRALSGLHGRKLCVLGLAFKGGTDDIRESPALNVIARLLQEGACLQLHDPQAMEACQREHPAQPGRLEYCTSVDAAARGAEAVLILTDWDEYRRLDLARLKELVETPIIIDGRNLLDPESARSAGFEYVGMGRETGAKPRPAIAEGAAE